MWWRRERCSLHIKRVAYWEERGGGVNLPTSGKTELEAPSESERDWVVRLLGCETPGL